MKRRKFIQNIGMAATGLAVLPLGCSSSTSTEILILGGGISGLYLAHQLQKAGKDFILLEGSGRFGGRLFSHPKIKRDVGGRGVGDKYVEVMKLVKELEVEMLDITDQLGSPSAIYLDGKLYPKWEAATPNPSRLEFSKLRNAAQLEQLDGWFQRPDLDEKYADFLKKLGHTDEELQLINISSNCNDVFETSAINSLHSRAFRKFNGTRRLLNFKNGSKDLIKKMVAKMQDHLFSNKIITKIKNQEKSAEVTCKDGTTYRAKKVVSTLPFTTLREVEIDVPLNPNQKKAIQQLAYTSITQIHLQAKKPFWEADNLPIEMWTDTPLERIMKINPNPAAGELVCWINGKGTAFFEEKSDLEIADFTLKKMKEIRPATEGKLEYVGTHHWGKYPFNKGAYVEFGVGQAAWFEDMIRPAGNVHFAGEHAARNSRGIEGAAESAVRVFNEIYKKL